MNNKDFILALASRIGRTQVDTQRLVTAVLNAMSDNLIEGNNIAVKGFGTFEIKKKHERVMINPSTRKRILVPPKLVLGFKPDESFKSTIKQTRPNKD